MKTPRRLPARAAALALAASCALGPGAARAGAEGPAQAEILSALDACFADPAALAPEVPHFEGFTAPSRCAARALIACQEAGRGVEDKAEIACTEAVADATRAEGTRRVRAAPVGDPDLVAAIRARTRQNRLCDANTPSGSWMAANCRVAVAIDHVELLTRLFGPPAHVE